MTDTKPTSTRKPRPAKTKDKATTLLLIRHGNTPTTGKILPGRTSGLHLSEQGADQAERVAERLCAFDGIEAVYSSPLERAAETAAPTAKRLGLAPQYSELLLECDFGDWTGKELKHLYKLKEWSEVQSSPSTFRFPNGESFTEMALRVSNFAERVRLEHPGGLVAAFSHADPIKALLCQALGMHLDMFQRLVIGTCSVSAISYYPQGPTVLGSNWQHDFSLKVS